MRHRAPHRDWKRCLDCGRFTDTLTDECENCGETAQEWVGGWVSDYYKQTA